jgi:hypothetical protein
MSIVKEIPEYTVIALRKRAVGVCLTNSDCRVALREAKCDVDGAFKWLLDNKIIERLKRENCGAIKS